MHRVRSFLLVASVLASTVVLPVGQASALAYKDPTGDDRRPAQVAAPQAPSPTPAPAQFGGIGQYINQ